MPLGDADIFKAKLFQTMTDEKEKKAMVTRWNALDNVNDLFRTWMHVKRAEEGKTEKEVAQRKFFEKRANLLGNWQVALDTLEALNNWDYEETAPAKAENIMGLLSYIPHDYCWYPISIFWYKHAQLVDGEALLPNDKIVELELLATRTVRYYFLYAVAYSSINRIKDATYRVNAAIYHDKDYLEEYKKDYNIAYEDFERNIRERRYGRSRKGLVSLLSVLNPRQDQDKLYNTPKWELEHILPKRGGYNNYNSWTEEQYAAEVESLGNLVMLEKPLNIRASAEFFQKKQKEYKKSAIQDACDLLKIKDWTYDAYRERHAEREETLLQFFRTME